MQHVCIKVHGRVPNTHADASHRIAPLHGIIVFPNVEPTSDTPSLVPVTALLSISLPATALSVIYSRRGRLDDLPCSSVVSQRARVGRSGMQG